MFGRIPLAAHLLVIAAAGCVAAAVPAHHAPIDCAPLSRTLAALQPVAHNGALPVVVPAPPAEVDSAEAPAQPVAPEPPAAKAPAACPQEMVLVQGSHCNLWEQPCVRWDDPEGQPAQRVCAEFQKPSICTSNRHPMRFCIDRDEYAPPADSLPAAEVSWSQADMLCASMGKRLCTSVEWEFACEGEQGLPYPYGYQRAPALCNQDRLLRDGKYRARSDLRERPHPSCLSPFGVRDMVGNVDEWVRRPWAKAPRRSELRGGWWMTGRNRCRANTSHHDEKYSGRQTGFRCCKEAGSEQVRSERAEGRTAAMAASR